MTQRFAQGDAERGIFDTMPARLCFDRPLALSLQHVAGDETSGVCHSLLLAVRSKVQHERPGQRASYLWITAGPKSSGGWVRYLD